tara:strand:+ start:6684 stop:8117 length:1434 start_codon:yes stop_codon:yes gene_type:complete
MATFQEQVQDLTSLTVSDTDELSQFLKDGVIDVTNKWLAIRPQDADMFMASTAEQASNGADLNGAKIVTVVREDGTNNQWRKCRKISLGLQYDVTDPDSLNYASATNPAYMQDEDGKISVFPVPGSDPNAYKIYYVNNTPVDASGTALAYNDTDIKYFPSDKIYLVTIYASMRLVQATIGGIANLSITAVPPDVPSAPSFSGATVTLQTAGSLGTAPTYTSPTTTVSGTAWATAYPDQYSAITTAWTALNAAVDNIKTGVWDDSGNYSSGDFTKIKNALDNAQNIIDDGATLTGGAATHDAISLLTTEEDLEMVQAAIGIASSELQRASLHVQETDLITKTAIQEAQGFAQEVQSRLSNVSAKTSEYQVRVQDALNTFNKENVAYQSTVQEALQELQVASAKAQKDADLSQQKELAEYSNRLQRFQNEITAYQADIGGQVQEHGAKMQGLQAQYNTLRQQYTEAFGIAAPKQPQGAR